ncbi:hypothetical protein IFM89_015778 [Coptis chinensis]|uniref:Growth-regulating factor n=1 Tax=Coptis chinensis TaxID=261450 RepID=A0A835IN17_9MAGN|nr:hypothetical protein IFM89_015778 [Coptis chinensis]
MVERLKRNKKKVMWRRSKNRRLFQNLSLGFWLLSTITADSYNLSPNFGVCYFGWNYEILARGSCYNLRFSNGDPEPGRCRRTDGKKWRCSRDVAQRHMHRSRPRSRKPVELQTKINNSNITSSIPPTKLSVKTTSHQLRSPRPYPQPSVFLSKPDLKGIPF